MPEAKITLVVDNIVKVEATEIASLLGLKNELENLSSEFSAIKKVLQDAETRQISEESVRGRLQKLKRVAYDLDDLLEEWIICFGDQVRNSSSSNLTYLIKHPFWHLNYRERVDEIKSSLQQIAREKERYGFSDNTRVRGEKNFSCGHLDDVVYYHGNDCLFNDLRVNSTGGRGEGVERRGDG